MSVDLSSAIIYPIIFILPAWVANGAPVIFGGGTPLDLNKKFMGNPIFGKHKTIRGTAAGLFSGFVVAFFESLFIPQMLVTGIMLSVGTHVGDLFGSFIKRRMGRKEGHSVPLMDQYLFLVFALIFALPFGNFPNYVGMLVLIVLTGILHRGANVLAHRAKMKPVPW